MFFGRILLVVKATLSSRDDESLNARYNRSLLLPVLLGFFFARVCWLYAQAMRERSGSGNSRITLTVAKVFSMTS
jgi:hypothetical protein